MQVLVRNRLAGQGPGHEPQGAGIDGQHLAEGLALADGPAQQFAEGRVDQQDAAIGIAGGHPLGEGGQDPGREEGIGIGFGGLGPGH
jgi:hypothetical protein